MRARLDRRSFHDPADARGGAPDGATREGSPSEQLPRRISSLLEQSSWIYVSPLRSDARESRCHAQLWYGWLDGSVVVNTAADSWRARCIARGLTRARVWVGDHGHWRASKSAGTGFRSGASFDATARIVRDEALLVRLLAGYEAKYPAAIGRWREPLRRGVGDGSRVLIRYAPDPASARGAAAAVLPLEAARSEAGGG